MNSTAKHVILTVVALAAVTAAAGAAFVWSGVYDVGADAKHTDAVKALLATTRNRSIEVRADDLKVPDLNDESRITQGAGNYDAMCAQCHLAPGMQRTELSKGLYPEPPNLTKKKVEPAHAFWVIKHGLKASGMPAWGVSMKDEYIWDMAAFLQKLPDLDEQQYHRMVASSGGHSHGGGESAGHSHAGEGAKGHHHSSGEAMADHHAAGEKGEHSQSDAKIAPGPPAKAPSESTPGPAGHHDDGHKH